MALALIRRLGRLLNQDRYQTRIVYADATAAIELTRLRMFDQLRSEPGGPG